jgi:hypothetical protein
MDGDEGHLDLLVLDLWLVGEISPIFFKFIPKVYVGMA